MSPDDLLRLLRQADRSLARSAGEGCQAANREGFLVQVGDVRRSGGLDAPGPSPVPGGTGTLPPEAGQLQYLTASPSYRKWSSAMTVCRPPWWCPTPGPLPSTGSG